MVNRGVPVVVFEVSFSGWVQEMRITKVKKGSIDLSMRIFCVVIMFESLEIAAKIVKISKNLLFYRYLVHCKISLFIHFVCFSTTKAHKVHKA